MSKANRPEMGSCDRTRKALTAQQAPNDRSISPRKLWGMTKSPPYTTWATSRREHVFFKRYPGTLKSAQAMSGKFQLIAV